MDRRRIAIAATVGLVALRLAALVGMAGYYAIPREEDEGDREAGDRR